MLGDPSEVVPLSHQIMAVPERAHCSRLLLGRPRIFEPWTLVGRWPQPPQHQTHGTHENHTFTGVSTLLIVLTIAPAAADPGKGALHHPTNTEWLEALRVRRPAADLHPPAPAALLG